MRTLLIGFWVAIFALSATAVEKRDLDQKLDKLMVQLDTLQTKPDKRIPPDVLQKAKAVVLLERTKAGFVFAFQGGSGVAIAKDKKGQWGPVAFMRADEASLGFQVGGQQSFVVILFMNDQSAKTLTSDSTVEFGGEAAGTAGDSSGGHEGTVTSVERSVLVYDDRHGLFGGAAVKGGALSVDHDSNRVYYGQTVTMDEVLFGKKIKPTPKAEELAKKLTQYAKAK